MKPQASPLMQAVDLLEITQFDALAQEWWQEDGPMAPLHQMNPIRLDWINAQIRQHFPHKPFSSLNILDVGCGGGLVTEPLARLGAVVTGIDGAEQLISIAKTHAKAEGLDIAYRHFLTDTLIHEKKQFDVVLGLEVIEHVPDQAGFISDLAKLTKTGGLCLVSTLNRSPLSFATAIIGAEYVLGWLPRGTHSWKKFVKPSEMHNFMTDAGLEPLTSTGLVYNPLHKNFALAERNLSVNYLMAAQKPAGQKK